MVGLLEVTEASKKPEVEVKRLTLLCCKLTIWSRKVLKTGLVVSSSGWDLYHGAAVCIGCGKSKGHKLEEVA